MFTFYDDEDEYEEEWEEEEYEDEDEDEFDDWDDEYEDEDEEEDWDEDFDEEDDDEEEQDDEDMELWEESATFVCEDCGYRWTEEDNDNEIIACPMCGSDNITQID